MKMIKTVLTSIALVLLLQAQAQTQNQNQTQNQEPRALTDKTMSDRLQKDVTTRNSSLGNTPVTWYDAGYGYYGTYSQNDQNYMIRYDRNGNYVETLSKREWNDKIPAATRNAFTNSTYKNNEVTGYWEVTDPGRKGAYYELSDASGKRSRVWADGNGKFSNQPAAATTKPRP